nr:S-methyl-5-thioribose-1-phosphate isomerase [Alicyclobacillus contaminans]
MRAIHWTGNTLELLDQTRLPHEEAWIRCNRAENVATAIVDMKVRGAPAIAISAAYAVALEAIQHRHLSVAAMREALMQTIERMCQTRPTAVNLFAAMRTMSDVVQSEVTDADDLLQRVVSTAERLAQEDVKTNRAIGRHGAELFLGPVQVLTHCNTGSLATVEYGTALGVIRALADQGRLTHVYVDETRPYLQGARLTAYELSHEGIPHTLITDSMAAHMMKQGKVDAVIVGADRIAANGDTANKIGTYGLAVLAKHHQIPFYVAAPLSTFDMKTLSGEQIPIEERRGEEVTELGGVRIAPVTTRAAHPAFDVTPHELITAIITEVGVIHRPTEHSVRETWMKAGDTV